MLNSKPNGAGNYRQGNFIPINKDKVIKLNDKGGLYYRSSWELTAMRYFDNAERVVSWGAECITIPYQMKKYDSTGMYNLSKHRYYPDFYYELLMEDGSKRKILLEVKPIEQTRPPILKESSRLSAKQLKSYQWSINEYNRNMAKWEASIEYCKNKGIEFKVLTKEVVDQMLKSMING